MTPSKVWTVTVTNTDGESWLNNVCDSRETALHAVEQIKKQYIFDGICDDEAEVNKYYKIDIDWASLESFADIELATPLDE